MWVSKGDCSGRACILYFTLWCEAHRLSAATVPHTVSPAQSTLAVQVARPTSDLPTQCEPDELSKPVSVYSQALSLNLPTPELVDASRPAPPHTRRSVYDHPALQLSADDDSEWSTLPQRKPRPRELIATSAKFRLPIRSLGLSPKTENHKERTGKRPRITLYHPPPRTVTVDLDGLEDRYALVRGTMRKVRTLIITYMGLPSLFQCVW